MQPEPQDVMSLHSFNLQCKELSASINCTELSDIFAVIFVDGEWKHKLDVQKRTMCPLWNEPFEITVNNTSLVSIKLVDQDAFQTFHLGTIGVVNFHVRDILDMAQTGGRISLNFEQSKEPVVSRSGSVTFHLSAGIAAPVARMTPQDAGDYASNLRKYALVSQSDGNRRAAILRYVRQPNALSDNKRIPSFDAALSQKLQHSDLNQAIYHARQAASNTLRGQSSYDLYHFRLSKLLSVRYWAQLSCREDLDDAIHHCLEAVNWTPEGHQNAEYLSHLSRLFGNRFNAIGDVNDFTTAMSHADAAIKNTPVDDSELAVRLQDLASMYTLKFATCGARISDLNRALDFFNSAQAALQYSKNARVAELIERGLGGCYLYRFNVLGDSLDLSKAVKHGTNAAEMTTTQSGYHGTCHNFASVALLEQYHHGGEIADLDKSIFHGIESIHHAPAGHPNLPGFCINASDAFHRRYERFSKIEDLDGAIKYCKAAVDASVQNQNLLPKNQASLSYLLTVRFDELKDKKDINDAAALAVAAVHSSESIEHPSPYIPATACFAHVRKAAHHHEDLDKEGEREALETAINCGLSAVNNSNSKNRRSHAIYWSHLGSAYRAKSQSPGVTLDGGDLGKAIEAFRTAMNSVATDNPFRGEHALDLVEALLDKSRLHGASNKDELLSEALRILKEVAESHFFAPHHRLRGAMRWAGLADKIDASLSFDAYACVIDLLPRVAWLGLTVAERHKHLTRIGRVVCDAAACAITLKKYETAVEWLEQGRSVVWGQLLRLRSSSNHTDEVLARELKEVACELDQINYRDILFNDDRSLTMEQIGRRHRELASRWEELVERARKVPGCEEFLRAKKVDELVESASEGPVVVINVHRSRCDALILTQGSGTVLHVPLHGFSHKDAHELYGSLNELLYINGILARSERAPRMVKAQGTPRIGIEQILSRLWFSVAKPVLDALVCPLQSDADLPRIWWSATGPLAFLPIHAAGLYDADHPGSRVSGHFVSSYTPTVAAILPRRDRTSKDFRILAISQPSAPGAPLIPSTGKELDLIEARRTDDRSIVSLRDVEATVSKVVKEMSNCSWLHLACHGVQNTAEPTESAFLLQDGPLKLSDISMHALSQADFAFLSACQTATGILKLSEEAVHLAAGMLMVGFEGVIATMWSIRDRDAPLIADEVYGRLLDGEPERPDHSRAALALHHAVERLRGQSDSFLSWVPFIHIGR